MNRKVLLCTLVVILLVFNSFAGLSVPIGVEDYQKYKENKVEPLSAYEKLDVDPDVLNAMRSAGGGALVQGLQEAIAINGPPNVITNYLAGDLHSEFQAVRTAVNSPYVEQKILDAIRNTALDKGVYVSPQERKVIANAIISQAQSTTLEDLGAGLHGAANAVQKIVLFYGAKAVGIDTFVQQNSASIFKVGYATTKELAEGDLEGAGATFVAGVVTLGLPTTAKKIADQKVIRGFVEGAKAWAGGRVVGVIGNKWIVKVGKKTFKTSVKNGILSLIALSDDDDVSGLVFEGSFESESELQAYYTDVKTYHTELGSQKFYEAPEDKWAEIPSGKEGYVYMKHEDEDGGFYLYAKAKDGEDGVIQRQHYGGSWSEVGPSEPVSFGSDEEKYDQAPVGDWKPIDAGKSGWTYRKVESEEGSGELILYARPPSGRIQMYDSEKKKWVSLDENEKMFFERIKTDSSYLQRELAGELDTVEELNTLDEELPPVDVGYDAPEGAGLSEGGVDTLTTSEAEAEGLEDSTYYYSREKTKGILDSDEEGALTESSAAAFAKLGIVPAEVPPVSDEVSYLASRHLSKQEISRRTELRDNNLRLTEFSNAPINSKTHDFKWNYDPATRKFNAQINLNYIDDNGDPQVRVLTFSNPGAFIQILENFKDAEHIWGDKVWDTIRNIDTRLEREGWTKKETTDLNKPKPMC
jgi:hypothetical protein